MALPLVLVPGLGCTGRLFAPQLETFSALGQIHMIDHGQDVSMAAIAKRFLVTAPQRFALAGLSMGGYIAFEIIRQASERVARLALLDTNAIADTPERITLRRQLSQRASQGQLEAIAQELYPSYVHPAREEDAILRSIYLDMMRDTGPHAFQRQLEAIATRPDSSSMLGDIKCPTLIVVGAEDKATPLAQAQMMSHGITASRLAIIPDCGHLSTLEKPKTLTKLLHHWWREAGD